MPTTDPRRLRPSELCRLLNSTPLGEVISERQLHRHRTRAGLRIGDARHVDLLRYVAWLMWIRHAPKPDIGDPCDPYEAVKKRSHARNQAISLAGRDIGELPAVVNPERKARAITDFRHFCDSYFPLTFHLPWSSDHLQVIAKIEQAVLRGGLFAMAMPRGSGKALALNTPLATPWGWTTMGQIQFGDLLFDEDGWPCRVVATTEVLHERPCFRVAFSDGESIVCDANHLWTVEDRWASRRHRTLTTEKMCRHDILLTPCAQPEYRYGLPMTQLPVDHSARRRLHLPDSAEALARSIVRIDPVPSVPVRCIQVDSPSQLYLAGRKMVPTHNSTICECACIWAVLYGHREFICLIGSDEGHAMDMLDSIKMELDGNEILLEDFPEAVFPIHALDGIANRCNGQLYRGERTHIGWTAKEIILPTIPGSKASGAIIKVAGITGRIRGMKYKRADGQTVRPTLVVLDDPQTDEAARSLSQCATRESILAGAVLGLAGPGKKISGIMPCTVIRPGDMADNILSRDKHPEWNGARTKMIYTFPSNEKLWQQYAEIRAESLRQGNGGAEATDFYRQNQAAMDEGSVIAWPERFNPDELSAVQHAMNLRLQDEAAFFAEYQNEPLPEEVPGDHELSADQIAAKINRMERGAVPLGCGLLTAFIDVQANLLFFVVAAWQDDFTGYVLDYGTFPDQRRPYFTLRDARLTLALATRASGLEGAIYAGLEQLTRQLLGREWNRDDGAVLRIDRCLIDANWGSSTDIVYQYCRQSAYASTVMPSHGRFVGASSQPFSEYKRRPGDRVGHNWRIPNVHGKRAVRHVLFDTNYWKTFVHARLAVSMGERGCLSLFGGRSEAHRLLAEHLTAEYRVKTEGRGRTVDEWKIRPEHPDNHWLDCLVGCAVAASIQGAALPGTQASASNGSRGRVSFAKLQKQKRS